MASPKHGISSSLRRGLGSLLADRRSPARAAGPRSRFGPRGIDTRLLLPLLFPHSTPEEIRDRLQSQPPRVVTRGSQIREILLQVDQYFLPSPFLVRFDEDDLVETKVDGMPFIVDGIDHSVALTMLKEQAYEPHLTSVFRQFVKPGMTVLDIGANIGYYSMLASKLVGPDGHVYAFEPSSENCRLVLLNAELHEAHNLELLPIALSDGRGWSLFTPHVGSNAALGRGKLDHLRMGTGTIVPTFRLDDVISGRVDFMKLDIEGAEGLAVAGAQRVIAEHRPIVTTELSKEMLQRISQVSAEAFLGSFEALGYRVNLLDRATGQIQEIPDSARFLADWTDPLRIEDLLLLPRPS